jgi:hypothetical protein
MMRDDSLGRGRRGRIGLPFDARVLPNYPPKMNTIGCLDAESIVCLIVLKINKQKRIRVVLASY